MELVPRRQLDMEVSLSEIAPRSPRPGLGRTRRVTLVLSAFMLVWMWLVFLVGTSRGLIVATPDLIEQWLRMTAGLGVAVAVVEGYARIGGGAAREWRQRVEAAPVEYRVEALSASDSARLRIVRLEPSVVEAAEGPTLHVLSQSVAEREVPHSEIVEAMTEMREEASRRAELEAERRARIRRFVADGG